MSLSFSCGAFLYVAVESAVYVWMPTLIAGYHGSTAWLGAYSISIFFLLRAAGRFVGAWMLKAPSVDRGSGFVLRADSRVLCGQRHGGSGVGNFSAPAFGVVHVGDLSNHQFEGHQLASGQIGAPVPAPGVRSVLHVPFRRYWRTCLQWVPHKRC